MPHPGGEEVEDGTPEMLCRICLRVSCWISAGVDAPGTCMKKLPVTVKPLTIVYVLGNPTVSSSVVNVLLCCLPALISSYNPHIDIHTRTVRSSASHSSRWNWCKASMTTRGQGLIWSYGDDHDGMMTICFLCVFLWVVLRRCTPVQAYKHKHGPWSGALQCTNANSDV